MIMRECFRLTLVAMLCWSAIAQTSTPPIPSFAPIPSTGLGTPIPQVGYRVEPFGEGAYMITDGIYQNMFLVTNESVIVVDAPPTIGHNILRAIRTVTDLPISNVVYSHSHADHIGAAYLIVNENTTVIAHEDTVPLLASGVNPSARPIPNITFADDYELISGNQTLQLSYKGLNHDPGNIFIYAPYQRVLMLVDVIYPGWTPFSRLGESQYIPGWMHAHDQVLEYDFDHMVSGHINRAGTRQDVLIQREYVHDLYKNCAEAILLSADPANNTYFSLSGVEAADPNNEWAITSYYVDYLMTDYCVNKTSEKWMGRLPGLDVYGSSNANTMVESLRLDFGVLGPVGVIDD